MTNKNKTEWKAVAARVTGILVILTGVLLAARVCVASPPGDHPIPSIFDPHSTPAESIRHLSHFVLAITGLIFLLVFSLLSYVVVKFRWRVADAERWPAPVYGGTHSKLPLTLTPLPLFALLFSPSPPH